MAQLYTNAVVFRQVVNELTPGNGLDNFAEELCRETPRVMGVHNRRMALLSWCALLSQNIDALPLIVKNEPKRVCL